MCVSSKRDYLQAFTHVSTHFIPTSVLETQQPSCQLGFLFYIMKETSKKKWKSTRSGGALKTRATFDVQYQSGNKSLIHAATSPLHFWSNQARNGYACCRKLRPGQWGDPSYGSWQGREDEISNPRGSGPPCVASSIPPKSLPKSPRQQSSLFAYQWLSLTPRQNREGFTVEYKRGRTEKH